MLEERLNYPSIPSTEKDTTNSLSYEEAVEEYAIKKYNKQVL